MKILRSVDISGLWGSKTLTAKFFPDANFLIGRNGSGKTTVINLIAAVLTADIPTLDKLTFEQIRLELRDYDNEQESIITVSKAFDKSRRFQVFSYVFKDAKGEREYSSDEMDPQGARRFLSSRRLRVALLEELSTIAKVQWLSIHRSPPKAVDEDEDESYESTVDRKLDELSRELIKFFSKIASAGEAESTLFQKNVFGSLLYAETSQWDLVRSASDLNLEQEEATLQEIFKKLGFPRVTTLTN